MPLIRAQYLKIRCSNTCLFVSPLKSFLSYCNVQRSPLKIFALGFLVGGQIVQAQTIEPITWNVIGLDSNKPATAQPAPGVYPPDRYPVGVEICNNTGTTINDHKTVFVWDEPGPSYLHLWDSTVNWNDGAGNAGNDGESTAEIEVPSLAAGECADIYHWVQIEQVSAAYNHTRDFHIELWDDSGSPADTATNGTQVDETPNQDSGFSGKNQARELYVEYLVSQNRNAVTGYLIDGQPYAADGTEEIFVLRGQSLDFTLTGQTATQGYEQIEVFATLAPDIFEVSAVTATYSANAGTDSEATRKLYADGCGWLNDPNADGYHTSSENCTGVGKYGGKVSKRYTMKISDDAPFGSQGVQALIYDFSGSSYHYNADYAQSSITFTVVEPNDENAPDIPDFDASINKTAVDNGGSGNGEWGITVTRETDQCGLVSPETCVEQTLLVTDELPDAYALKGTNNSASADYGTLTFFADSSATGDSSLDETKRFIKWDVTLPIGVNQATATIQFDGVQNFVVTNQDQINNCANIDADKDSSNNQACAAVLLTGTQPAAFDVGVQKSVTQVSEDGAGNILVTFKIQVNTLSGTNTAVVVSDALPPGFTFQGIVSNSQTGGISNGAHSSGVITFDYAAGSTSGEASFTAVAALPSTSDTPDTLASKYLNTVSLLDPTGGNLLNDLDTGNNQASAGYVPPLLSIEKTPATTALDVNSPTNGGYPAIDYTLTVKKVGALTEGNTVKLTEAPPPGLEFTAINEASGTGTSSWTCKVDGLTFTFPTTSTVECTRSVAANEASPITYPTLTFVGRLNPTPTTDQEFVNSAYVEAFDGDNAIPNTFDDDDAVLTYSMTELTPVSIRGVVFLDEDDGGTNYDGLKSPSNPGTEAGGGIYACINTSPAQYGLVQADGTFEFMNVTQGTTYTIILTTQSSGEPCPTSSSLNSDWYSTGESADDLNTDTAVISKQTVSDGKLQVAVGSNDVTTLTFGVVTADIFDPPFGIKTADIITSEAIIRWTMVWINNSPITIENAVITDPIPTGTTYRDGSIVCSPAGSTTVSDCSFDSENNRVDVTATFGPETGNPTDADSAANELLIQFDVNYDSENPEPSYLNQGTLSWNNGTSTTDDPGEPGDNDPTEVIPPSPDSAPLPVPTLPTALLGFLAMLMLVAGYGHQRRWWLSA